MNNIRSQLNVSAIAVLAGALAIVMPANAAGDDVTEVRDVKTFSQILVEGAIVCRAQAGYVPG